MDLKCLICGKPATNDRRGLCSVHYSRFVRARAAISTEHRLEFESELVRKKLLLPPKPKGRQVENDVFADLAGKYMSAGERLDQEAEESIATNPPGKTARVRRAMNQPKTQSKPTRRKEAK